MPAARRKEKCDGCTKPSLFVAKSWAPVYVLCESTLATMPYLDTVLEREWAVDPNSQVVSRTTFRSLSQKLDEQTGDLFGRPRGSRHRPAA